MFDRFVERPILSGVIAALILLAGIASLVTLPIAQYPQITPPQVVVTSTYIGANATTVESAVTNPLEEQINGVQGMTYLSSTSSDAGISTITITFDPSRNIDAAAVDVQNRVQNAQGALPSAVTQAGIQITKTAGSFIMAIAFTSTSKKETLLELSNYLDRNVKDPLLRVNGVSAATEFGVREYAMRIWLDAEKMQHFGLGPTDVATAVANQNVEVPAGQIGAAPGPASQQHTINVYVPGQLATVQAFGDILVKHGADGSVVRLSQVARVELGAQDYSSNLFFNGKSTVGIGIEQNSGANAIAVADGVRKTLESLKPDFPAGVSYAIPYDTTLFVTQSLHEVINTLLIAIVLVVFTIFVFLQDIRTTAIPAITIPISLFGTFAFVKAFGFSINTLVLFGITLATGLVVDDAIVVIENIARVAEASPDRPRRASAIAGLNEIVGAVVATSLVLLAVFIPTAFIPGTTGAIYKQFALTIAFSIALSAVLALTLTPALSATFGKARGDSKFAPFRMFNDGLARLQRAYGGWLGVTIRLRYLVLAGLVVVLAVTGLLFVRTPTAFIPTEDQGVIFAQIQAPVGASLNVVNGVLDQLYKTVGRNPNVDGMFGVAGFSFAGSSTNQGIAFITLKPWGQRPTQADSADAIIGSLYGAFAQNTQASLQFFNPPAIPGLGTTGGFDLQLQDFGSGPLTELGGAADRLIGAANRDPRLAQVYTTFRATGPEIRAVVNRDAAEQLGVGIPTVFGALSIALGSAYVNNFTYQDRTYRVYVQNDAPYRQTVGDIARIAAPNASATSSVLNAAAQTNVPTIGTTGVSSIASQTATVPLASLVQISNDQSAPLISHYDLYRSVEIQGSPAAGRSSGDALTAMAALEKKLLPSRYHLAYTGISLDESSSGSTTLVIFAMGLIVVYLVLAALYESLGDPLVILLSVPAALLGALLALGLRGIASDVYAQVGFVMLIGLSAKNAILIVEFAIQRREAGASPIDAVIEAAQTRLRPILMTSIAFILGLLPLVFATGAGSASRHSLGTAVVGGMIVSTVLNLIVVPSMYVIIDEFGVRLRRWVGGKPASEAVKPSA
jgi:hydrophobic/amphiphilic exporter-1 (mainly G- bacteria), HAE1 family